MTQLESRICLFFPNVLNWKTVAKLVAMVGLNHPDINITYLSLLKNNVKKLESMEGQGKWQVKKKADMSQKLHYACKH